MTDLRAPMRLLLDLVLPVRCAGCGRPEHAWCPACHAGVDGPFPVRRRGGPPMYALAAYAGPARRAVLAYKERGRRDLAAPLGRMLGAALPSLPGVQPCAGTWVLVPAPSRPSAARLRGGSHMLRLARHTAATLAESGRAAAVAPALRLHRRTRDSVGLDPAARAANLAGGMLPNPAGCPPPDTSVVVLDDVITTGATAAACVATLARAGVTVTTVLALTVAG
ncbi:putative amidophosphoribosyltransferase [Herbihabitans rhizosphaerae]|uniref:Putative amidophosphoribosyltransferase n=1 Tax=Herbihabitans rhizosphaerae TaxID=1872711 RepID=A0A4Q7KHH7_9PSEU|nr:ComF family protein [Herbihabitans rhizosphaerae]RZS33994.1 putative amidophosphoribosyltransferase [Herbihabitans rhizosphaerae]